MCYTVFILTGKGKSKLYKAVIFDLDGTLLNTIDDLAAAANHTLAQLGLPQHTTAEIMSYVGNGIPMLLRRMVPQPPREEDIRRAAPIFDAYYTAHKQDVTAPYPGIPEMLDAAAAHGVKLAVLSNKKHAATQPIIRHYFGDRFAIVQGLEDGMPAKPDPTGVNRVLTALGCAPGEVLYVGDSDTDMLTARGAGLFACGVLWGFRSREVLLEGGAQVLCENAAQLTRLILETDNFTA